MTQIDVLTFGETMLRFTPPGRRRLVNADTYEVWVAGSESNVAAALVALGRSVTWVGRLPDNPIGRRVETALRCAKVNLDAVVWTSAHERVGTFYAEQGVSPRNPSVVYDRAGSAAASLSSTDLPDQLFGAHRHLHVSGITPALSSSCRDAVADAIVRARSRGSTTSFDVNYRAKLWSTEDAADALSPMIQGIDVIFCSRDDASRVFGVSGSDADRAAALRERFNAGTVVVTAGKDGAVACDSTGTLTQPAIPVEATVERYGSGDAFAAGFLADYLIGASLEHCLKLAVATAAVKRTIPGDLLTATRAEIEDVLTTESRATWR